MSMDYTDLNKACPKDPYPLPSIDKLVDGVSGFALLSFMDAYSKYNQIQMHPRDEEKTAFIIDNGTFYYKVMSFGLKNTRATYQCLMDKIFKDVIEVDVEVYIDDMVVKSEAAGEHYAVLTRVFRIMRKHQLRLNPEKCSLGVQVGKFMGFMLTEKGIEANPEKCQAVIIMRSPQTVKEVQQFMGRVTALSRFISRAAKTTMPIFGILKKGANFVWTSECEEAFLKGKESNTNLPIRQVLRKPDLVGRMVAWSVQLSEFDISFEKRGHIKAQALANFVTELTPVDILTAEEGEWFLSVDGSSNRTRSGAGIVLEGPNDVLIEQSLHFKLRESNNQGEYEALLRA
ncbi:hypothetical protein CR513_00884, partial [Mucuna pruriens]